MLLLQLIYLHCYQLKDSLKKNWVNGEININGEYPDHLSFVFHESKKDLTTLIKDLNDSPELIGLKLNLGKLTT